MTTLRNHSRRCSAADELRCYGSLAHALVERARPHDSRLARADRFDFDVDAGLAENSGKASDSIASPKFSLVLGPWSKTEFFFNAGSGFHSNDARGTTITVDPTRWRDTGG